jgi:transcription elongation GreA/GreB family factor/very-short-patch-repair endonuclease
MNFEHSEVNEDIKNLLNFASGVITARERVHLQMSDHRMGVFRQETISGLTGLSIGGIEDEWLRIKRQKITEPNKPSEYILEFIKPQKAWDPTYPPALEAAIAKTVTIDEASELMAANLLFSKDIFPNEASEEDTDELNVNIVLHSSNLIEMQNEFEQWLNNVWKVWAQEEKPRRQSIKLYDTLFQIYASTHTAANLPPEIVWGFGVARTKRDGKTIDMPVVEQEVEIVVETDGDIVLIQRDRPLTLNLKPFLELEFTNSARLQSSLGNLLNIIESGDIDVTPSDFDVLTPILETAANELDAKGQILEINDVKDFPDGINDELKITKSWSIYCRPRSSAARVTDLSKLHKAVDERIMPPECLKGYVAPEPDELTTGDAFGLDTAILQSTPTRSSDTEVGMSYEGRSTPSNEQKNAAKEYTYFFPLPYNEDQASIIDTIEGRNRAVANVVSVTGPPGTGKSHTIANILAHCMAKGQRVLVTARTAEAISVVKDKLPENLQNLVIASTGTDRDSIEALKTAVTQLAEDVVTLDTTKAKERRIELEEDIVRCDDEIRELDLNLSKIARANLERIEFNNTKYTPMELMTVLKKQEPDSSWFSDRPNVLPDRKIIELVEELKKRLPSLAPDFNLLEIKLPTIESIPTVEDLLKAHESELSKHSQQKYSSDDFPPMAVDSAAAKQNAASLLDLSELADSKVLSLSVDARNLFEGSLLDPNAPKIFDGLIKYIRNLGITDEHFEVSFPKYEPLTDLQAAAVRGRAGQNPAPGLFNRSFKRSVGEIRISGNTPVTPQDWEYIKTVIDIELDEQKIAGMISELPSGLSFMKRARRGWDIAKLLNILAKDLQDVIEVHQQLAKIQELARTLFPVGLDLTAIRSGDLKTLIPALRSNLPADNVTSSVKEDLKKLGEQSPHQFFTRIGELSAALGDPVTDPRDIVTERGELTAEMDRLIDVSTKLTRVAAIFDELKQQNCSEWIEKIKLSPSDVETVISNNWIEAWTWAYHTRKLEAIVQQGNGDEQRIKKSNLIKRRERLMEDLIKVRTMLGLHQRMTSSVQRAMQAFTQAVSRLGRGTGQTAPRFRQAAQREAQKVATVAPVWVMPEYRIAEQLPPDIEAFDLVILDEASQSDITAIAALARGKQVLIVGDEEQVSPTNVGIPKQKIDALRAQFLSNLPNADLIDENTSIFEITLRMFPQHHLILKEHFRCAPPIIQFSTQFYNNRLVPIRVPRASERFDPPLVDVYIEEATRKGKTNLDEANFIVDEIHKIITDPTHNQRDIGVVSLIGQEQANLIENLLLKHEGIGPEVMRKRNIICGDARTLQGQERSVIFLSMVATPSSVIAQTKREIQQRYNVAMSRGKDRVYLVRSVALSDIKSTDIKSKLLKHFEDPMPEGRKIMGNDALELCDSGFEKEVLTRLLDAGYRAKPQVEAGAYRIDIVVEGNEDRRLAIELDGDAYHGPDKWADDMRRQSILERAGWVFWRVFGSQWQQDKEYWWNHLIQTLEAMDITPIGSEGINGAFVEYITVSRSETVEIFPTKPLTNEKELPVSLNLASEKIERTENAPQLSPNTSLQTTPRTALKGNISSTTEIEEEISDIEITEDSCVILEMEDGTKRTFVIVQSDPDPENGKILPTSPLGEALLGNFKGDVVEYEVGEHVRQAEVLEVTVS